MNSLPFQIEQPLWLLLPVFVVSVAIAFFLYSRRSENFSSPLKWILRSLRFLTLFVLGLLLLNVFFFHQEKQFQKPIVVVALDESESMIKFADSTQLLSQIKNHIEELQIGIEEGYQIDLLSFDQKVKENPDYTFDGKRSDIDQVFKYIDDKYYMLPLEAVILISDGQKNQGLSPVYRLENSSFPVYPLIIGDTNKLADLSVEQVFYNKVVRQNANFPVDVLIQAYQFPAGMVDIKIQRNGRTLAQKEVEIKLENESKEVRFELQENTSGLKYYQVVVSSDEEEINIENNTADFYIQLVESGKKVLVIGNNPHPDIGAIAASLRKVDGLEVDVKTLSDFPFALEDYQLFILHGLPSMDERSEILLEKEELKTKALWYIWTSTSDFQHGDFPYFVGDISGFEYAEPQVVDDFNEFLLPMNQEQIFDDYPPLYVPYVPLTAKTQISNLFTQQIRGYDSGEPLWSFWDDNGVHKSFLAGEGIWKWKLHNYQRESNHYQFDDLVKRVAKYLLTGNYRDRFNVQYQDSYNETDQILIEAQVLNNAFENIENAEVSLALTDQQGNEYPYQFSNQSARYMLDMGFLNSGVYNFQAKAETGDTSFVETGDFVVESWNLEAAKIGSNISLLQEIAHVTNGQTYMVENKNQLIEQLNTNVDAAVRYQYIQKIINLIDLKFLLILLISLLTTEWFLRKYFGI